jgi:Type II secretion system protein C
MRRIIIANAKAHSRKLDPSMNPPTAALPWPWRAAAWIATVAAGVALALVLAHWGWRVFGPPQAPLSPLDPPERWAPAIATAPIFGRAGAQVAPTKAVAMEGDVRLLGVFAERDGTGYALFRLPAGPVLVHSGQDVAKDVRLEAVNRDGVRLRDHGEVRTIALRAPPSASPAAAPDRTRVAATRAACASPAGYQGPVFRVNAELLTGIGSQTDGWKALLVAVDGGLAIRDDSGFAAMLGMRGGDRMTQANGIALASIDDVLLAVVKPLVANQPVRVAGTRAGKPAEWLFVNASACS